MITIFRACGIFRAAVGAIEHLGLTTVIAKFGIWWIFKTTVQTLHSSPSILNGVVAFALIVVLRKQFRSKEKVENRLRLLFLSNISYIAFAFIRFFSEINRKSGKRGFASLAGVGDSGFDPTSGRADREKVEQILCCRSPHDSSRQKRHTPFLADSRIYGHNFRALKQLMPAVRHCVQNCDRYELDMIAPLERKYINNRAGL